MPVNARLCPLEGCQELATHKCHIKDRSVLKKELETSNIEVNDELLDDQNHIFMCPTHHLTYFDKIHGPQDGGNLMYIDVENKIFIIASSTRYSYNLDIDDCEVVKFSRDLMPVNPEYLSWKNSHCYPAILFKREMIVNGWLSSN